MSAPHPVLGFYRPATTSEDGLADLMKWIDDTIRDEIKERTSSQPHCSPNTTTLTPTDELP